MKKLFFTFIAVFIFSLTYAQIPTNGLVSYYPFTGNAADSSATNHGTVNGATLSIDRFGKTNSAYNFNSQTISLPSGVFHFPNYSYSLWVYINTPPSSNTNNVIMSIGGSGLDQGISINNNYVSGPTTYNGIAAYSSGNSPISTTGKVISSNTWYHIVAVRDSSKLKMYVDGKLTNVSQSSGGILPSYGSSSTARLGSRYNQSLYFSGKIDEVRIYNRALDSNEVLGLYNQNFCINTINDTNIVSINDTIAVYDTTHISVFDTSYVTIFDTTYVSVTDTLIIDAVLSGVNPPNNINQLKAYPNPTRNHLFIDNGNFSLMNNYRIRITNALGQEVFNSIVDRQLFDIDLSSLTGKGTYFLMLYDPQNNIMDVKKIILQ